LPSCLKFTNRYIYHVEFECMFPSYLFTSSVLMLPGNSDKSRHANLHAFGRALLLSRHIPSIPCRIHEIALLKNVTISFLVTRWTLTSSKCVKMWLANALARTPLGELTMLPLTPQLASERETLPILVPSWHPKHLAVSASGAFDT